MSHSLDDHLVDRRILILEDEWLIALDLQDLLQRWRCSVIGPVATTAAALELIEDMPPDAAILDVQLSGETSEPVAQVLRERGTPFLLLTAYQRHHLAGVLREAPVLRKPVDETELRTLLADLLRSAAIR